jgi:hypothetical protein
MKHNSALKVFAVMLSIMALLAILFINAPSKEQPNEIFITHGPIHRIHDSLSTEKTH